MQEVRTLGILHPVEEDFFHLAPVPFIYHQVEREGIKEWHQQLIANARQSFSEPVLEVPDVRHIQDLGSPQSDPATI